MKAWFGVVGVIACGLSVASCDGGSIEQLGAGPARDMDLVISPDHGHAAWVSADGRGMAVHHIDDKVSETWGQVEKPIFSPDSHHTMYAAWKDGQRFVVTDGVEGAHYMDVRLLTFSPDSQKAAYIAFKTSGSAVVVVNGKEGPGASYIDTLMFSPDSGRIACRAQNVTATSPPWPKVEGVEVFMAGLYDPGRSDAHIAFSADGKHIAYCERVPGGADWLVVDGARSAVHGNVDSIYFSPDGSRIAYTFTQNGGTVQRKMFYNLDGVDSPAYEDVWGVKFTADGKTCVCDSSTDLTKHFYLSVNGKVLREGERILPPILSKDGLHMAYAAKQGRSEFVVRDGVEGKHYAQVIPPIVFSLDGKRVAYGVELLPERSVENECVVVDGVEGTIYDSVSGVVFSPDSKHIAYRERHHEGMNTQQQIVVDGKELSMHDRETDPVFGPDSLHVAYCAGTRDSARLMVDDRGGQWFRDWLPRPSESANVGFDSATQVHCLGVQGKTIVRARMEVP